MLYGTGIRVVVVLHYPWHREEPDHAQLFESGLQCDRAHRIAVIDIQDQWLAPAFADPFSQSSPAHQFRCDGGIFLLADIPGHHLAAPVLDKQIEVQPDPAHGGGERGRAN